MWNGGVDMMKLEILEALEMGDQVSEDKRWFPCGPTALTLCPSVLRWKGASVNWNGSEPIL